MYASRIRAAGVALAASLGLSACATYGGFGQSGVSVGIGQGGYHNPYGYGYDRYGQRYGGYGYSPYGYGYSPYGYGYSPYGYASGYYPWAGWHNGYYYPGTGRYVYRDGRRLQWTPAQRGHFEELRRVWQERARARDGGGDQTGQQARVTKSVSGARELRRPRSEQVRRQVRAQAQQERRAARSEARQERRARAIEALGGRRSTARDTRTNDE